VLELAMLKSNPVHKQLGCCSQNKILFVTEGSLNKTLHCRCISFRPLAPLLACDGQLFMDARTLQVFVATGMQREILRMNRWCANR